MSRRPTHSASSRANNQVPQSQAQLPIPMQMEPEPAMHFQPGVMLAFLILVKLLYGGLFISNMDNTWIYIHSLHCWRYIRIYMNATLNDL